MSSRIRSALIKRAAVCDISLKVFSITPPPPQTHTHTQHTHRVSPSPNPNTTTAHIQAQFDAGELITQRELVSSRIRSALIKRAAEFDIALEDISITHLTFGKEFTQAVEMKQVGMLELEFPASLSSIACLLVLVQWFFFLFAVLLARKDSAICETPSVRIRICASVRCGLKSILQLVGMRIVATISGASIYAPCDCCNVPRLGFIPPPMHGHAY